MNKLFKILFIVLFPLCTAFGVSQLGLSVHDTTLTVGDTLDIPVYADSSFTGQNVLSYRLQLNFSSYYFVIDSVYSSGTITQSWGNPSYNKSVDGKITIAAAGSSPLAGKGILVFIRLHPKINGGSYFSFADTLNNYFNEGSPRIKLKNGYFTIKPRPTITVYPNNGLLTVGETLQFNSSNGSVPYTWSVTNPAVASINSGGLLTAEHYGFTKVVAKDANNIVDTSDASVEVRAFKLSIRDTSFYQGQTVDVPVYSTDLTGLNLSSGQLTISFNQNILTPIKIINAGTLLETFSSIEFKDNGNGQLSVSFAGNTALNGKGILFIIRYVITSINTGSTTLGISNITFNENILGNSTSGRFSVVPLANLNISPSTATLIAGDTLRFKASGGTAPYSWNVSDSNLAAINSSGLLTAKKGGIVKITASDLYGGTGTSGNITLYDTKVNIPDTNATVGASIDIPVYLGKLNSSFSISSLQVGISFDSSVIKFDQVVTSGTMSDGWAFQTNNKGNQVIIAGAGSGSFGSEGIVAKLRFNLSAKINVGKKSSITIQQFLFNEGSPAALTKNGSIIASSVSLPISPSGLNVDSTQFKNIFLKWVDNSINEDGYKVERSINNTNSWAIVRSLSQNSNTYIDTGLVDGTKYYYRVFAFNAAGNSGNSNEIYGITKLLAPYNLQAASSEAHKITLTWSDVSSNTIGFIIERKLDETGTFSTLDSVGSNNTTYVDSNLAIGSYFVYRVKGYNNLVESKYSNEFGTTVTKVDGMNNLLPEKFMIYQNFPNPFNPSTNIKYQIPEASLVKVVVYDLLGRKVAMLINQYQSAGFYNISFDASKLTSGIYIYKISAGNFSDTRKMLLVK